MKYVRINAEKSFTVHPNTILVFEYIICNRANVQTNRVFVFSSTNKYV